MNPLGLIDDPLTFATQLVQAPKYEAVRVVGGWIAGAYGALRLLAPFAQAWLQSRRPPSAAVSVAKEAPVSFRTLYVEELARSENLRERLTFSETRMSKLEHENANLRGVIEGLRTRNASLRTDVVRNDGEITGE